MQLSNQCAPDENCSNYASHNKVNSEQEFLVVDISVGSQLDLKSASFDLNSQNTDTFSMKAYVTGVLEIGQREIRQRRLKSGNGVGNRATTFLTYFFVGNPATTFQIKIFFFALNFSSLKRPYFIPNPVTPTFKQWLVHEPPYSGYSK